MTDDIRTSRIRELNNRLRTRREGGEVYITSGIQALGPVDVLHILRAVQAFDDFSEDNDPYGEHDCAVVSVGERRIIWKIDYYNRSMTGGSEDPSDPDMTRRVLTIMLSEEY